MRITRLELKNYRMFSHIVMENIPDLVVLVSRNGLGKSTILEAIAGAHDLVIPYEHENYSHKAPRVVDGNKVAKTVVWPQSLRPPVRKNATRAEFEIVIEPSESERSHLTAKNIPDTIATVKFEAEHERHITSVGHTPAAKELFRFHSPAVGVGYIDYIRPTRAFPRQEPGGYQQLSDDRVRSEMAEFGREWQNQRKYASTKTFIIESQLQDWSMRDETGREHDSLAQFRQVFDYFFAPKRFVGARHTRGCPATVDVWTPFGVVDIDELSEGEKDVLHILAYLYRFRDLQNVVLWDTPESHLNAALEGRLLQAIRTLAPHNQYWIATHSLELIHAAPLESIFSIQLEGDAATIERVSAPERASRVTLYSQLGAQVGLQLVSSLVIFCEGKNPGADKRILERLLGSQFPYATVVAGGACGTVLGIGDRANELLEQATQNGDFLGVVDRDYRSDEQMESIAKRYGNRIFVWSVHEIENLFMDPTIIFETLSFLGKNAVISCPRDAETALRATARELRDWIAADWVAWEYHFQFDRPERRISGTTPLDSLNRFIEKLRSKVLDLTDAEALEQKHSETIAIVDELTSTREGTGRLPGKQILKKFVADHTDVPFDHYIDASIGVIIEKKLHLPEVERLKARIVQILRPATQT